MHNYLHTQPLYFSPKYKKAINSRPDSALICPTANPCHFHSDQRNLSFIPHMGEQNSFFTEATHITTELLCLWHTWLEGSHSAVHAASSSAYPPSNSSAVPPYSLRAFILNLFSQTDWSKLLTPCNSLD